jgi:hypothetical protein
MIASRISTCDMPQPPHGDALGFMAAQAHRYSCTLPYGYITLSSMSVLLRAVFIRHIKNWASTWNFLRGQRSATAVSMIERRSFYDS